MKGLDYSTNHPPIQAIVDGGYEFVCRYLYGHLPGKAITAAEVTALHAAGLGIVLNWETVPSRALGGLIAGQEDAHAARGYADHLGAPDSVPIYFSVDFDDQSGQDSMVAAYLHGLTQYLPPERIGVYGGLHVVSFARATGLVRWFWQTYAWSHGHWMAGNNIEQYQNGTDLAGGQVDLNRAPSLNPGAWFPMAVPNPPAPSATVIADTVWRTPQVADLRGATYPMLTARQALYNTMRDSDAALNAIADLERTVQGVPVSIAGVSADPLAIANALAGNQGFITALASALAERLAGAGQPGMSVPTASEQPFLHSALDTPVPPVQ